MYYNIVQSGLVINNMLSVNHLNKDAKKLFKKINITIRKMYLKKK